MTARSPAASSSNVDDLGAEARRGLLYIPMAKAWFLIAGLAMQFLLPRALGSSALFGMWTLVAAWLSTPNNIMVTATIQAVAHFAASGAVDATKRTALRMNVLVGGGTALLFLFLAPIIGSFEHDEDLISPLRLSSAIVLLYSFYAVFVGAANGARQFHKQAGLDMIFATLRVGLVLVAAAIFHAILPAVGAWLLTTAIVTLISIAWVGLPAKLMPGAEPADAVPVQKMLGYIGWLLLYLGAINVLMFLDGWWLKRLCTEAAVAAGGTDIKHSVNSLVGIYGAAQTVARLPYQLILAGAFVVFPLLSVPAVRADKNLAREYVTATLRYSLIAVLGMVAGLGVRPEATLRLLFAPEYSTGAAALSILLAAYVCFSLMTIIGTITNSLGHKVETALLGTLITLGTTLSVYLSISRSLADPLHAQPLRAAALGLLVGMASGLGLCLIYLYGRLRATMPLFTLLRVGLALACSMGLGFLWPAPRTPGLLGSKLGTLLACASSFAVYFVVLLGTRELAIRELLSLRRARPKAADAIS